MILFVLIILSVAHSFSFTKLLNPNFVSNPSKLKSRHQLYLSTNDDGYSLGAPRMRPDNGKFITKENVLVEYQVEDVEDIKSEVNHLIDTLDDHNGNATISSMMSPSSCFLSYRRNINIIL
jgi:hypothetical protein